MSGNASDEAGNTPKVDAEHVAQRYSSERSKRIRDDTNDQFIEISLNPKYESFTSDPWVNPSAVKDARLMFPDNHCHLLILGAGWGGLLYAIRMIQAGVNPDDIRIVDPASGFGGTWYWNRYPGIDCDIESYCYLPLLEDTGYVPRHRYADGDEIRQYAELAAQKWGVADKAVFGTKAEKLVWDEGSKEWQVELVQHREGEQAQTIHVWASFVATVNGVLNWPKLPGIPGILDFGGDIFHSSRWNYEVTGGSPTDLSLSKLQGKRVAIIGTGATAVQIIPHLAKWTNHLYVVQRTPAAVDHRKQWDTDTVWFRQQVAISSNWQRERMKNFHQHLTTERQPSINMVNDAWTHAQGMVAIAGNADGPKSMEELPIYMEKLHAIDLPRQERIRSRVMDEVNDPSVAEKLKSWYPTWCKRPTFHEDYLSTFNRSNVTLVDTDGKGPDLITADSIVSGTQSYQVDIIICATGFRAPFTGSPAEKANMTVIGRDGISMSEAWARNGPSTQHGVMDANFPNLFLSGPWQAALSPNNLFNVDVLAKHAAYILKEAKRKSDGKRFIVTITPEAAADWGMQVLMHSAPMASLAGCTPGYFNVEGKLDQAPPEMQALLARSGIWGSGIEDFDRILEEWRTEGNMQGINVKV